MAGQAQYRPVLILGAVPRIAVAIARSLDRQGIPVEVGSFLDDDPEVRSRTIRAFHRLPSKDRCQAQFLDSLLALIRQRGFDMVLPVNDPALRALAENYEKLAPALHLGCPAPSIVERVLNKALTLQAAQECGIKIPITWTIKNFAELEPVAAQLRFPVVAKPGRKGARVLRVRCFFSIDKLSEALHMNALWPIVLQQYCPGVGVGVEMLIHNGECVAAFQHRRVKEAPASGGVAVMAIAEALDPGLYRSSLKLLRALEWEGPAMVEFRSDPETGNCVLMEVNGRYWGTSSLPILAGIDFPFYHWQITHGQQPRPPEQYAVGMRWRWTPGYLDRLYGILGGSAGGVEGPPSKIRELLQAPKDFLPTIREALWSWFDPQPFFSELAASMYAHLTAAVNGLRRKLTPGGTSRYAKIYLRLRPEARSTYAKLRAADALGRNHAKGQPLPRAVKSVLFVCYGNIMRSPMAEAMLKQALEVRGIRDLSVTSAGLHARPGHPPHPWATTVSRELGIPLEHYRARLLTSDMMAASDVIFAMDFENLAELIALFPEAKRKIYLLGVYAEGNEHNREISDPYYENEESTRRCYRLLSECVAKLAQAIVRQKEAEEIAKTTLVHS